MWKVFLRWDRVIDVCIPQTRDKFGKRFGFVRFLEVKHPKALEEQLDSVWIGTYKLRVNIPAFDREAVKSKVVKSQGSNGALNKGGTMVGGRSYANVLGEGNHYRLVNPNKRPTQRTIRWSGLEFQVSDDEMAWLKQCYVGKFSDPEGIQTMHQKYKLEELLAVSLTPMGGNHVLL